MVGGNLWQKWHLDLQMSTHIEDGYGTHEPFVYCGGVSQNIAGNLPSVTKLLALSTEMANQLGVLS